MSDREDRVLLSKLWFLVEWDVQEGPSTYSVVNWSSLIGPPPRQKLCTGKTVLVRRGKRANPANIVIMSEDKRFLDTELHQLRNIAAANLQTRNEIGRKRRKLHITADSPSDANSSNSSRHCSPSPTPSNQVTMTDRFNSAPPMTFDQQTQTESKILNNGSLPENVIVDNSLLEGLRENQTIIREDILELMRQMENMQATLARIALNQEDSGRGGQRTLSPMVLPSSSTPFGNKSASKGLKSPVSKPPTETSSVVDSDPEYEPESFENKSMPLGASQRMNMTFNGFSNNVYNLPLAQKPWETEIYPNDMVPIGSGKTLIPLHVMNQINWTSHSNATRRLLMSIFNRHTLATHTLTGKASPAFNGVMSKPQKMRLDPGKIMDIIETVSKYCGVKEGAVRGAITTKCADENKMLRARLLKEGKSNDENKENGDVNTCDDNFDLK